MNKLKTGFKIMLILLLAGIILFPATLIQLNTTNLLFKIILWLVSIFALALVYGYLFISFREWIFK